MPISDFFIPKILKRIDLLEMYDEDDLDMMRYSLQVILWEIEKIVYICIFFAIIGRVDVFFVTLAALMSIRTSTGGYHSKTSLGCLTISFIFFLLAIVCLPYLITLNTAGIIVVTGISLGITLVFAPIYSVEKERLRKKAGKKDTKWVAVVFTIGWAALAYFGKLGIYKDAALFIILIQNIQLLAEFGRRKWMKRHEKMGVDNC